MIVTWNHFADGKPTKILSGEVVSISPGMPFRFLLKKFDGTFETVDASNVREVAEGETISVANLFDTKKAFSEIAAKIEELGLQEEGVSTSDHVCKLLGDLVAELKDAGNEIDVLKAELAASAKKSPGRPRKDRLPDHES